MPPELDEYGDYVYAKMNPINKPPPLAKLVKFASKRAFGVELELGNALNLNQLKPVVESVQSGYPVVATAAYAQDTDNAYWHIKLDRSCGDIEGQYGCEVASYKAVNGIKDILAMAKMVEMVRAAGANVNNRCGTHVHVEVKDFSWMHMATLIAHWVKMEPMISHMIPANRADNKYCKFRRHESWVKKYASDESYFNAEEFWEKIKPRNFDNGDRRKAVNLCNFCGGGIRRTIEFRFPEASLDPVDMKNWVRFLVHLVDTAKKLSFPTNLAMHDFTGFLWACGLHSLSAPFYVLSPGLRETKLWVLRRVCKYSRSEEFKTKAQDYLKFMTMPKGVPEVEPADEE